MPPIARAPAPQRLPRRATAIPAAGRRVLAGFAVLCVAVGLLAAAPLVAQGAGEAITLNFTNAEIDAVVKAVAEITGKSFVVDPKVKGTVTIVSARPIPRSLVYPTLLAALRTQGVVAVEGDTVVRLVPESEAKLQGGPVGSGAVTATGERLITQVIPLRYESAAQLVTVLRPLISPANTIAAFPGANALVVTDYADNLRRLEKVSASSDQPPAGEPIVGPVRDASAIDLVPLVVKLVAETSGTTPPDAQQRVAIVADPRSNSVLVRTDNPGRAARVRQLIEQLDTPGRPGGNMFIVYLRNAEAARIVQTLKALLTGQEGGSPTTSPSSSAPTATGAASMPAATSAAAASPLPFSTSTSSQGFTAGGATISADTANNALVILAPEPVYNNLRAVIEKLDVRRAQVYVEALIVEVSADKSAELGIQWQALTGVNSTQTRVIGGTNLGARGSGDNILDVAANLGAAGQGLNLGVIRGTVNIPGLGKIQNLAFLARALETQVNANILSTPTLLTLDNEEARIVVGQNVPFVTGQYAQTGTAPTVTPFQTIERRDIGLLLRVKPQITEGGTVRLVLYQEVSRIQDQSSATGLILSKRSLESTVVVDDAQIVVLGGLIEDRLTDGTDKVPVAGDLPWLGQLFRYDARRREKTNLMIFLKPTILRSDADGREFTSERYRYLQGEQQRMDPGPRPFWNDPTMPTLPEQGKMPGQPGATAPGPATPPPPIAPFTAPAPAPPLAPPAAKPN